MHKTNNEFLHCTFAMNSYSDLKMCVIYVCWNVKVDISEKSANSHTQPFKRNGLGASCMYVLCQRCPFIWRRWKTLWPVLLALLFFSSSMSSYFSSVIIICTEDWVHCAMGTLIESNDVCTTTVHDQFLHYFLNLKKK